jgi:hypothetical protein
MYSSKEGVIPQSLLIQLDESDLDALEMWGNRQHGIFPNQYHHTYEQGDTMIYPEHIADLRIIDKIVGNKRAIDKQKEESKLKHQQNNPLKGGNNFYGNTFKFNR